MNQLIEFDQYITLLINSWHSPFWDQFFFNYSKVWVWFPFYAAFLYIFIKQEKKNAWIIILSMIMVVLIADQGSSGLLKPLVHRLRPTHDPLLADLVHIVNGYRGGKYGFVSSHAANSAGVALFLTMICRTRMITILLVIWALLTSYSRIYLGVHYVGDILGGMVVGICAAFAGYGLMIFIRSKCNLITDKGNPLPHLEKNGLQYPLYVYLSTCLMMLLASV